MTQEEKAKRYDKVIKIANEYYNSPRTCIDINVLIELFPELQESEDERIRKALIKSFEIHDLRALIIPGFSAKDVIAWLEKQGEHTDFLSKIQVGDQVTRNEDGVLVNLSQLDRVAKLSKKKVEHKSTDKVNTKVSEDPNCVFSKEQVEKTDKRISNLEKIYKAKLRDAMLKAADFPMTN